MPTMYPSQPFTKGRAEKILYGELKHGLGEDYVVIHGRRWIEPGSHRGHKGKQGECDFIILHPSKGILVIEAKSGTEIFYDGKENCWYRYGGPIEKDPVEQAEDGVHCLNRHLRSKIPGLHLPFNFALAFPETDTITEDLPGGLHRNMIILGSDLHRLQAKIDNAIAVIRQPLKSPLPPDMFQRIINVCLPWVGITTSLSGTLSRERREFFRLEEDQIETLNTFEQNKRIVVDGCSGCGKTLIAVQKAVRMSGEGRKVLLLCYNIPLADSLRNWIEELEADVDVFHFHGLCKHVVEKTGADYEEHDTPEFWDETSANLLARAIPDFPRRYDGIIVDETQDFCAEWWTPLLDLLVHKDDSVFYLLTDPRQNIFNRRVELPFEGPIVTLRINYRNTASIVKFLNELIDAGMRASDKVPSGEEPRVAKVDDDRAERRAVDKRLHWLINEQNLKPEQIVILGKQKLDNSAFREDRRLGNLTIVERPECTGETNEIRYSSVYRFKGLEADCVLLTGVGTEPRPDIAENRRALFYVGASRAKMLLYVFHR